MYKLICIIASPPAMIITLIGTIYWAISVPLGFETVDAILSGGATLFGQMIYNESSPRDEVMHKKLDDLIQATEKAHNELIGAENHQKQ